MPKHRIEELLSDIRIDIHLSREREIADHRHTSTDGILLVDGGSANSV
jgi:hypothetical protein